jgi:hypothetical protein
LAAARYGGCFVRVGILRMITDVAVKAAVILVIQGRLRCCRLGRQRHRSR